MSIVKWAAIAVTALLGLMNLGLLLERDAALGFKATGVTLGVLAVVAIVGLLTGAGWGRAAVIGVGVLNIVAALIGAVVGVEGWPIGLVIALLGTVLGAVHRRGSAQRAAVAA